MDQDGNPEIKDFSLPDKPKPFKVDGGPDAEVFTAHALLGPVALVGLVRGAQTMGNLAKNFDKADPQQIIDGLIDTFGHALQADSLERFTARLNERERPVDLNRQIIPILYWLMEEYGLRPTKPSTASSTTPPGTGTPSTDGAPAEASTPSTDPSAQPVSST